MILLIGGAGQGKLDRALALAGCGGEGVARTPAEAAHHPIFYALEAWAREEPDPIPILDALLEERPDLICVCREVGCGVVPIDRTERDWRERVGRMCVHLARRAERVERLFCGIPTILKGE